MLLPKDGTELSVADDLLVTATYEPADRGPGTTKIRLEEKTTANAREIALRLDPWSPEGYEVYEWMFARVLVISGARRVVFLECESLHVTAVICLDHGEGETISQPWFVEAQSGRLLVVATETRVLCLDERKSIRWCWSVRTREETVTIGAAPQIAADTLKVSLRSLRGNAVVVLSLADALEQVE